MSNVTPFKELPEAYRAWIMLDRNGRTVTLERDEGNYTVTMIGRWGGRATKLEVTFTPEMYAQASKAAGPIHVEGAIADAMVRRYNRNAAALQKLPPKERRKLEKTRRAQILDFSHPVRDPG